LSQEDVYENGASQKNAKKHLFDNSGLSGFVYAEESGGGTGLGFNGGNGNMWIDSGGRVDVSFESNGSSDPDENPRILKPGESVTVDLSVITSDDPTIDGGKRMTVAAAEPDSDRSSGGNGT
jgi:hypothetical protein